VTVILAPDLQPKLMLLAPMMSVPPVHPANLYVLVVIVLQTGRALTGAKYRSDAIGRSKPNNTAKLKRLFKNSKLLIELFLATDSHLTSTHNQLGSSHWLGHYLFEQHGIKV